LFILAAKTKYTVWQKIALPLLLASIILLVLVFIPGIGIPALGSSRRIDIGPIALQPAEFAKLALVIWLARVLSTKPSFFSFIIPVAAISGLVVLEPDLGTTVIIVASSLLVYFASGVKVFQFIGIVSVAVLGIAALAFTSEYRKERILTFLNPTYDPLDASYHLRQLLIALGGGGLFGVGLGNSRQKHLFLPEPATDSIFAIIAEEIGFLGAGLLLLAFIFLIMIGFKIAEYAPDSFGRLLAVGISGMIAAQCMVNIGAVVALIPLTGIPLPLVSYGGSSLVVTLVGLGILVNIAKHIQKKR
jgi:cell division protein FtsW